jgi:hypothetical protein
VPGGVLVFAVWLATPAVSAQPVKIGTEFVVNTYTTDSQYRPAVAVDAQGNFVVVWHDSHDVGDGIFGQRFDTNGTKVGPEFQVNTYTINDQRFPDVSMNAAGAFVVVWNSYTQDGSGWGVFGQRFDASGNKQGSEFQINTSTAGRQYYPAVAMGAGGDFVVVWANYGAPPARSEVSAQRFDSSGNKVGGEIQVNTYTTGYQDFAHVATAPGGGFVVVWPSGNNQDGSLDGIFGQRFDPSGSKVGPEFQVNTYTTNGQAHPRVRFDAAGNFVVIWASYGQDGSSGGIFGQRFDPNGAKNGLEFQANTATLGNQRFPDLAVAPDGRFVVVWADENGDGTGNYGVVGQAFDRTAAKSGPSFAVNSYTTSDQSYPRAAMAPSGGMVLAWQSFGEDGSFFGITGQRLALTSKFYTLTPCRVLDTRSPTGPYGGPALAALSDRTFIIGGQCGIPPAATGVSVNVTVTQPTAAGDLRIFPAASPLPLVSTINYRAGQTRANNAIALLGPAGDLTIHSDQPTGTTHFILDVNGYYQ